MIEVKDGAHVHYDGCGHYGYREGSFGGGWAGMIFGIFVLILLLAVVATLLRGRRGGGLFGGDDYCDSINPKDVLSTVSSFKENVAESLASIKCSIVDTQKDAQIAALNDKINAQYRENIICEVKSFVAQKSECVEEKVVHAINALKNELTTTTVKCCEREREGRG